MRWSKVRQLTEASFAPSVRGRVRVHVTNDDPRGVSWQDTCKRSAIVVDGKEFVIIERHMRRMTLHLMNGDGRTRTLYRYLVNPFNGQALDPMETDLIMDLGEACWEYLHSSIRNSLDSDDPFVQSLAILSAKVGKQRLRRLALRPLHVLPAEILKFRLDAERSHKVLR